MIRIIFASTVLFLLISFSSGWATEDSTYYVTQNGSGAHNGWSYADAWSASDFNKKENWSSAEDVKKIDPGDTVYICGNINSMLVIKQSGTKSKKITIRGDFPGHAGTISSPKWCGLLIRGESYVSILSITIHNCGTSGVVIDTYKSTVDVTGIIVDDVTAHGNHNNGILLNSYGDINKIYDVTIKNCLTYNNGDFGYRISGYIEDVTLEECVSHDDSQTGPMWGVMFQGRHTLANSGWLHYRGNIYVRDEPNNVDGVFAKQVSYMWLNKEVGGAESLDAGEYYYDTGNDKIYMHLNGTDPNTNGITIIHRYAQNVIATDCTVYNTANPTGGEGHGMGFEFGAKNCGFYRCTSYNNGDSNGGSGFVAMINENCTVAYCTGYGNHGSGFSGQKNTGLKSYNNVAYNNQFGFLYFDYIDVTIKNCIAYSNNIAGISAKGGNVTIDNDYNCSYGNGNNFNNISKGKHSLESDPLFADLSDNNFQLQSNSPCKDAGLNISGIHPMTDIRGKMSPIGEFPDIGAWEVEVIQPPKNLK